MVADRVEKGLEDTAIPTVRLKIKSLDEASEQIPDVAALIEVDFEEGRPGPRELVVDLKNTSEALFIPGTSALWGPLSAPLFHAYGEEDWYLRGRGVFVPGNRGVLSH